LKRFGEVEQIDELRELSLRPKSSPSKTEMAIEARVIAERGKRPDWGARKLRVLLAGEGIALTVETIHRILRRNQLIQPQRQHPPALKRFERAAPNQLWQMDFKGLTAERAHGLTPLSVLDDCSRFCLGLAALPTTRVGSVREVLTRIFQDSGLPEAMLMDHGKPWWNANHPNGWTRLSIWLMQQGIRLHFAAVRHPQTQGKVERFHRTLQEALRERGFPVDRQSWTPWLEAFREEYNHVRPHEALSMATPASRWQPSPRAFQPAPADWEYETGSELKRVRPSGQISIAAHEYFISAALAGQWVQVQPLASDRLLVFYRRTCVREIHLAKRQSYPVYFSREQQIYTE
jgi:transposase InsO family protein